MVTVSRDDIAALACELDGIRGFFSGDAERAKVALAAKVLRAAVAAGFPVLPLEIAEDAHADGEQVRPIFRELPVKD